MRKKLQKLNGKKCKFIGKFSGYGQKRDRNGELKTTVIFTDITDETGNLVSEHNWFNFTKSFESIMNAVSKGDSISFEAKVKPYLKGYLNVTKGVDNRSIDYTFGYPEKFKKI